MHMRIHSWYVTIGILGASALATGACTVTSTSTGDDGGTDSATVDTDTGVPATDAATVVTESGADGGIVCDIPSGADACDTCALTSCCNAENTCQTVEPTTDAGITDCEDIFSCVQDCLAPPADSGVDGGTFADCTSTCSASHTTQGVADFTALSTCLTTSCASQCE